MREDKLRIVFAGMIAADPFQGGATWAVLQYLLGFRQLGHEIAFVEPIPASKLQPQNASFEASRNARYFTQVIRDFGLDRDAALMVAGTRQTIGLSYDELLRRAGQADVLFNVSGMLTDAALLGKIDRRVYLDLDPAFIQLWEAVSKIDMHLSNHTHFVTVGQAIGSPNCDVPTCGRAWLPTLQPIVLSEWPFADKIEHDAFTTIGNWRGYGSIEHAGRRYGQKAHSWRSFFELPKMTTEKFAIALSIHPEETNDVEALRVNHWDLLDSANLAGSPASYRHFVQGSKAELGIAKSGYVVSQCGWFSDRSACYLASGRPVVAQETGFSRFLPTGRGLYSFSNIDDVLHAIAAINSDYPAQRRAARELAEEFFDSDRVLANILRTVGRSE